MNHCTVQPLEPRALNVAIKIHAVQMAAYAQEAVLLEVKYFPPLERTVKDIQNSTEIFLGVMADQELAGCIAYEIQPQGWLISSLVVSPQYQRLGIARTLVGAVLKLGQDKTIEVATGAKNTPALTLYRDFGFLEYNRFVVTKDNLEIVQLRFEAMQPATQSQEALL
jgi:ribosomal protein S18 acetylase RimI-like enzyme